MSDTHINVYFNNVTEAEAELEVAKGKVSTAKAELEAKKKEVGFEELKSVTVEQDEKKDEAPKDTKATSKK